MAGFALEKHWVGPKICGTLGCIIPQGLVAPHRSLLPRPPPPSCNVTSCGVHKLAVQVIAPPWRSVPGPLSSTNMASVSSPVRGIPPMAGEEVIQY